LPAPGAAVAPDLAGLWVDEVTDRLLGLDDLFELVLPTDVAGALAGGRRAE
jgi:hypothetical protein